MSRITPTPRPPGVLLHLRHEILLTVIDGMGPQFFAGCAFFGIACGGEHAVTEGPGQLDGGDANTTGTTLHQQPFWRATVSSTQAPALKQVAAHSQAILGSAAASTGDIPLGTGRHCSSGWAWPPPVSSAHKASPMPEPERVIATEVAFDQLPGHFQPRQAGHTWRRRVIALALGDIRAIDAGDRDLDQHFSRPWARNRTLRWLQYIRCTGPGDFNGLHGKHGELGLDRDWYQIQPSWIEAR